MPFKRLLSNTISRTHLDNSTRDFNLHNSYLLLPSQEEVLVACGQFFQWNHFQFMATLPVYVNMKCAAWNLRAWAVTACTQKCKTHIAMFAKNIAKVRRNRVPGLFKSGQESVLPWYDRSWLLLDIWEMQLGVIVSIVCCLHYCDNETEQILLSLAWAWWHHGPSHRINQKRVWSDESTGTWVCSMLLSSHWIIPYPGFI